VLSLLLAARLCQPTALINIPAWAERTGADLLWDIPAESLNDDRLGRALDAFFTQRHSILTAGAAQAIHLADLRLRRHPLQHRPARQGRCRRPLRGIVETIDQYGLRRRHLGKHRRAVD